MRILFPHAPTTAWHPAGAANALVHLASANGVSVLRSYGTGNMPSGHIIISVKKNGAACYSLDVSYADAAANLGILIYKDSAGTEMISLYGAGANVTATCPGGSPVALPSSGQCATDANALGGLMPASSCINNTSGACQLSMLTLPGYSATGT